jgi:predicted PhzF superfamily epimerase YddE/YHI9
VVKYLARFYVSNGKEVPICGHGTLAASKLVFSMPATQAANVHTIQYTTGELTGGATLIATKWEDEFIQIDLPSTVPGHVSDEEKARLKTHVDKAFGRDVKINDIKTGGKVYAPCRSSMVLNRSARTRYLIVVRLVAFRYHD